MRLSTIHGKPYNPISVVPHNFNPMNVSYRESSMPEAGNEVLVSKRIDSTSHRCLQQQSPAPKPGTRASLPSFTHYERRAARPLDL